MNQTREVFDPFKGETVEINNDLVRRLRGQYACGPTLPNGEPEFGWRQMGEPPAIHLEAADEIERLRALLREAEGPVVHHAALGCKMCIEFLPELRAVLYPAPPTTRGRGA